MTRGWLTDTDEYKYYFYSGSGVMAKGGWRTKKNRNAISVRPMDICVQAG